jgi:curved DNA-binding protein CbpA
VDPYQVLDVPRDADAEQVKRAHRRAAQRHHPDAGGEREDFERIQTAYLVLADPARRSKYDRTGSIDEDVENPMAALAENIAAAFDHACQQDMGNLDHRDLIAATRAVMQGQLAEMGRMKAGLEAELPRLERLIKRLRFKGDGPDLIGNVLRERLAGVVDEIAKGERVMAEYTASIAYLDHYGFDFDPPPAGTVVFTMRVG